MLMRENGRITASHSTNHIDYVFKTSLICVFVIIVPKVNGNVKWFHVYSGVETLLQEYLFTKKNECLQRSLNVVSL